MVTFLEKKQMLLEHFTDLRYKHKVTVLHCCEGIDLRACFECRKNIKRVKAILRQRVIPLILDSSTLILEHDFYLESRNQIKKEDM